MLSALTDDSYALNGGPSFHKMKDSIMVEGGPGIDFAMLKIRARAEAAAVLKAISRSQR